MDQSKDRHIDRTTEQLLNKFGLLSERKKHLVSMLIDELLYADTITPAQSTDNHKDDTNKSTNSFDKERFSELLKQAKGMRSINKYALDSGVDAGYISRLMRCLINTAPSAQIINKLADKGHNGVTVESLMSAAAYL